MVKTYLTNRGYSILKNSITLDKLNKIKEELTVQPNVNTNMIGVDENKDRKFKIYQESESKLYIPKYYGLKNFGIPEENKLNTWKKIDLKFNGTLRENQLEPVDKFLEAFKNPLRRGGLLNIFTGGGKTVISLYLISKIGIKSIIVTHKDFLMNQWKERIAQYLPDAKIGIIKQNKIDIENKDIILASLQSLVQRDYDKKLFSDIGFSIYDETHHLGAEVFSKVLNKYVFNYSLGLSATMTRKDGLTKVFKWHIGDVVFRNKKNENVVKVFVKEFEETDSNGNYGQEYKIKGKLNIAKMVNTITEFQKRNEYIVDNIIELLKESRQILLLSDRRNHLKVLYEMVQKRGEESVGYYIGGMKQEELEISSTKRVIFCSYSMGQEGLDIPTLNTLILSTPKSDIEQAVGRILRKKKEERNVEPYVLDIIDTYSNLFIGMGKKRITFYKKNNYNITIDKGVEKDFVIKRGKYMFIE